MSIETNEYNVLYGKILSLLKDTTKAKALAENHQKVTEVVYNMMGKDYEASEVRELFPTARTFPQIIVDGQKIGGYVELKEHLS